MPFFFFFFFRPRVYIYKQTRNTYAGTTPVKGEDVPGLYLNLHLVETFLRVNEALPNRNLLLPLLLQYVGLQGSRVIQANKSQGKTEKKKIK